MEGKGTYGIVYSNPRFPFSVKYNFLLEEEEINDESIKILKDKNEVSKIFFEYKNYLFEKNNYILLCKYNFPDIYFNKPLHFGFVDEKNIRNSIVYTYNWGGFKNDFKKIIMDNPFQITFPKGKSITKNKDLTIDEFYRKSINIIYSIKYLNENNFIFDDFKLSNIIEVDEIYKISDYSSIIHLDNLKEKYFNSYLDNYFYYIYLPVLNQALIYYLENGNYKYQEIYNDNYKDSDKFITNIIYKLYQTFEDYKLDIDFFDLIENKIIELNINDIFKLLMNYRKEKNNNKVFFTKFIEYLDLTYKDDNLKKIKDISDRINLFSLGMYFLAIFNINNNSFFNIYCFEDSLQVKILVLIAYLTLNFINIDNKILIFNPNIDNIIEYVCND
jgi:hypothetical protein